MSTPVRPTPSRPLRVGFIPLTDAAPLIVASEHGIFERHGVEVDLRPQVGWATLRDKIIDRELDAAHALGGMLFATHLGLGCPPCDVLSGLVLNLHGNAITLSTALRDAGVRDAATLRDIARARKGDRRLTLGVVFHYSSHHAFLRAWLRSGGIDPERDVRVVIVPPAQMFRNLAAGTIDGYCVGEPWSSVAIDARKGWSPIDSATFMPGHVEKVLMVRRDFAEKRASEHLALIAALHEACAWCDDPRNRESLAVLLARREWLNLPKRVLLTALLGRFPDGTGAIKTVPDFHIFHSRAANVPSAAKGGEVLERLVESKLIANAPSAQRSPARLFREDIFHAALSRHVATSPSIHA